MFYTTILYYNSSRLLLFVLNLSSLSIIALLFLLIQVPLDTNFPHRVNLFFFLYHILLGSLLKHCSPLPFSFFVFFFSITSCFPPRDSFIRTLSTQCQDKFFLFNHCSNMVLLACYLFLRYLLALISFDFSHHSWLSFSQYIVISFFYHPWLLSFSLSFSFIPFNYFSSILSLFSISFFFIF